MVAVVVMVGPQAQVGGSGIGELLLSPTLFPASCLELPSCSLPQPPQSPDAKPFQLLVWKRSTRL